MPEYRVALRHTTLVETAPLVPRPGDTYFIATTAPPPTNSILTLHDGEDIRYFVVDAVVEVDGEDRERGILGKLTDEAAHEEASKLGTEHLEDGTLIGGGDVAPQMAMPAPVVDPDPSGEVDVGERERLESETSEAPAEAGESATQESLASADGQAAGETPVQAEASKPETEAKPDNNGSSNNGSSGRRGRKRKGRKRR